MKTKLLLSCLFIAIINTSYSQGTQKKDDESSKTEKFTSASGRLIKREFIDIGRSNGCEFKVMHMTDLITNEKISALRIEKKVAGTYTTDTKIAVLDADEIDALLKSFRAIKTALGTTPAVYTEISFTSRGGFEAGSFYSTEKSKWSIYMKLEEYDSNSYVFMKTEDLDELIALAEKAKEELGKTQ